MDLFTDNTSEYECVEDKVAAVGDDDARCSEHSTLSFIVLVVLGLMALHCVCVVVSYLICVYRFITVWNHIFQSQDTDLYPSSPLETTSASRTAARKALVTMTYSHMNSEIGSESEEAALEKVCPICLVDFQDEDRVSHGRNCSHLFHEQCVLHWMERQPSCPCCRQDFKCKDKTPPDDDIGFDVYDMYEFFKLSVNISGIA